MVTPTLVKMSEIRELHIEASSNCQARCVMCTRTDLDGLLVSNLSLSWVKENIDATTLDKIMFCGNLGDPCANTQLLSICKHLKEQNPDIVLGVNTNGALQSTTWWAYLAGILNGERDYVVFSIDGSQITNELYRKNVSWYKLMNNAFTFIEYGGSAHWDMLVFKHNEHEVAQLIESARNMGFTWFRVKESSRWDMYPPGTDGLFPVNDNWKAPEVLPEIVCEANRDCSRYIDALGHKWPCCHMAEAHAMPGYHEDLRKFSNNELLDNYNTRLTNDPYDICKKTCGTTTRTGQWVQTLELTKEDRMSNIHTQILEEVQTYLNESEKFEDKGVKASAARARKALGNIGKLTKERRAEIQNKKNAM